MFSLFRKPKKVRQAVTVEPAPPPWAPPEGTQVVRILNNPGTFSIEIKGEGSYQEALAAICGGRNRAGHRKEVDAYLVPEDDNPYDQNAVRVVIEGHTVGYLNREMGPRYRQSWREGGAPRDAWGLCRAKIVGGWDRGGDDVGHFGVKLDM